VDIGRYGDELKFSIEPDAHDALLARWVGLFLGQDHCSRNLKSEMVFEDKRFGNFEVEVKPGSDSHPRPQAKNRFLGADGKELGLFFEFFLLDVPSFDQNRE